MIGNYLKLMNEVSFFSGREIQGPSFVGMTGFMGIKKMKYKISRFSPSEVQSTSKDDSLFYEGVALEIEVTPINNQLLVLLNALRTSYFVPRT